MLAVVLFFFFSSRRRHTRCSRDWSSDVCSSDLEIAHIDGAVLMPLGELPDRLGELDGHHEIVTHCHHGARSLKALEILKAAGFSKVNRKSTRLNSSHGYISYAVFCLKKKKRHTAGVSAANTEE